jgi:hypothetical protein
VSNAAADASKANATKNAPAKGAKGAPAESIAVV